MGGGDGLVLVIRVSLLIVLLFSEGKHFLTLCCKATQWWLAKYVPSLGSCYGS